LHLMMVMTETSMPNRIKIDAKIDSAPEGGKVDRTGQGG
jgi:hypothetical protein